MNLRKLLIAVGLSMSVLLLVVSLRLIGEPTPSSRSPAEISAPSHSSPSPPLSLETPRAEPAGLPSLEAASSLAAGLNAPHGTISDDLQILNSLLTDWRLNFPRLGHPVGDNAEITTALTGDNPLRLPFISRRHSAINSTGELCDRWNTPFRFHALAGDRMEIRSAGPDRKFGTDDDSLLTPP